MKKTRIRFLGALALGAAAFLAVTLVATKAQQPGAAVKVNKDAIGGVVTSSKGPEAGVWVIAETTDLPHALQQDGGHRRPGPLCDSGSAQGQLHGLGARLRHWSIPPRRSACRARRST